MFITWDKTTHFHQDFNEANNLMSYTVIKVRLKKIFYPKKLITYKKLLMTTKFSNNVIIV